jgi:hypothetical protein
MINVFQDKASRTKKGDWKRKIGPEARDRGSICTSVRCPCLAAAYIRATKDVHEYHCLALVFKVALSNSPVVSFFPLAFHSAKRR